MTLAYASELTLEQYQLFASLLHPAHSIGRPRSVNLMLVVQAIVYVLVSGCAWRLLPKQYPPYSTCCFSGQILCPEKQRSTTTFSLWRDDGSWQRIHDHLVLWVRLDDNRDPAPVLQV